MDDELRRIIESYWTKAAGLDEQEALNTARNRVLEARADLADARVAFDGYKDGWLVNLVCDTIETWLDCIAENEDKFLQRIDETSALLVPKFHLFSSTMFEWSRAMKRLADGMPKRVDDDDPDKT